MRTAVVGVGVAGSSHLLDVVTSDGLELVAVCATRLDRATEACATFGAGAAYDSVESMFDREELDAIVIATPPSVSADILDRSLERGLLVLVEKPAAGDRLALERAVAHDAQPLSDRSAGTPRPTGAVVAYNRRYQGHVRRLGELLADSGGPQATASVECEWRARFRHRYTNGDTYRSCAAFGHGVLLDTFSHVLDTLLLIGLEPGSIGSARLHAGCSGADIEADVTVCLESGADARIRIQDAPDEDSWRLCIRGAEGSLWLTRERLWGLWKGATIREEASELRRPVDDLLAMRAGESTLGAPLSDAVRTLALIDAAREAARTTRPWRRPRAKALGRLNGAC